jgi:predicted nucleic-acid-binding protein
MRCLLRSRHLIVEEREIWRQAINSFASTLLQMTDCYIAARALRDGVDVHTFDQDLGAVMQRLRAT